MARLNRREFLDRSKTTALRLAAGATLLGDARRAAAAQEAGADQKVEKRRPDVVVVYYPHWHNYDHGSAWKGEGWTEWTEGCYLLPEERTGTACLEAIRRTFGA